MNRLFKIITGKNLIDSLYKEIHTARVSYDIDVIC